MAFDINRFVRQTLANNAGQITTSFNPSVTPAISNGPALFTYASATDAIATIIAADYFAPEVMSLSLNDVIIAIGSDAANIVRVSAIDRDAGTIAVVALLP